MDGCQGKSSLPWLVVMVTVSQCNTWASTQVAALYNVGVFVAISGRDVCIIRTWSTSLPKYFKLNYYSTNKKFKVCFLSWTFLWSRVSDKLLVNTLWRKSFKTISVTERDVLIFLMSYFVFKCGCLIIF